MTDHTSAPTDLTGTMRLEGDREPPVESFGVLPASSANQLRLDAVLAGDRTTGPSNVPLVEFLGVFEPKHRPLSTMTPEEIEAMADEMYDYIVERLDPDE